MLPATMFKATFTSLSFSPLTYSPLSAFAVSKSSTAARRRRSPEKTARRKLSMEVAVNQKTKRKKRK